MCQLERDRITRPTILALCEYNMDFLNYPENLDDLLRSNGDDRWDGPYIAATNLVDPWGTRLKCTRYVQDELNDYLSSELSIDSLDDRSGPAFSERQTPQTSVIGQQDAFPTEQDKPPENRTIGG